MTFETTKDKIDDPHEEIERIHALWEEHGRLHGSVIYWQESSDALDRTLKGLVAAIACIWVVRMAFALAGLSGGFVWLAALVIGVIVSQLLVRRWLGWT